MLNLRTRHLQLVRRRRSLAGYKLNIRGLPDFFAQTPNAVTSNRQGAFAFQASDCHSQTGVTENVQICRDTGDKMRRSI